MLASTDIAALVAAAHSDPFAVLGLHADAKGKHSLRAMLPGAIGVDVLDLQTGKHVVALELRDDSGLWEAAIPRRKKRFEYRLKVQWADGSKGT